MALLGRAQPQPATFSRLPLIVILQTPATGDVTGVSTAAGTVTASRSDVAAVTGAVTASGTVSGVASIPAYRINRGPFGRT